jgi:hypothetical protein
MEQKIHLFIKKVSTMRVNKDKLREMVAKIVSEIEESDLVVRKDAGQTWEQLSSDLREDVENLIVHITNDEYQQALEDISQVSATMKMWKHRIIMGGKVKKSGEDYNLGRFNLGEKANPNQ